MMCPHGQRGGVRFPGFVWTSFRNALFRGRP